MSMQKSKSTSKSALLMSISNKQRRAQELREKLEFSIKIQNLFPNAFEGDGVVKLRPVMKKSAHIHLPNTYPVGCRLIDSTGRAHQLNADQYFTLYPHVWDMRTQTFIRRAWDKYDQPASAI